jgi:hypothetical protein
VYHDLAAGRDGDALALLGVLELLHRHAFVRLLHGHNAQPMQERRVLVLLAQLRYHTFDNAVPLCRFVNDSGGDLVFGTKNEAVRSLANDVSLVVPFVLLLDARPL